MLHCATPTADSEKTTAEGKRGLSRRTFLGGIAALGAAAVSLPGCAPKQPSSSAGLAVTGGDISWDEEFDVIVVGAGIAGLSSAITVAREGDGASCLLIEKEAKASGCSPVCDGDSIYSIEYDYLKNMATSPIGLATPEEVLQAFKSEIDNNLQWLLDLGAKEDQLVINAPGETFVEYREYKNDPFYSGFWFNGKNEPPFNHVYNFLEHVRSEQFADTIDFRTNTPLEELVQDPATKEILGIVADGKAIRARRGVIMCIGGFEHNPELLESFLGVGSAVSWAMQGNVGDGLAICAKVGADFWHMHSSAGFWMAQRNLENTDFSNGTYVCHKFKAHGITVANNGRRFYMDWDGHKSLDEQNDVWTEDMSLHVGTRHGMMQFGGEWVHLPMPSKAWFIFDSAQLNEGAFDFETTGSADPVADGWLLTANTLEELAEKCGMVADNQLARTVEVWNNFCEQGEDSAFFRPADTLTPIVEPPFYAQLCVPTMLNTDGGPKRSPRGEVLDVEGNPIPGLYAAGEFGSVWGYQYQGCGNVAEAQAFGRIAARNACGRTTA